VLPGRSYRRLRGKLGPPKAITAMAHKLARFVYRLLMWGHAYIDKGQQYYEERHREQQVQRLKQRAARLGLLLVAPEVASPFRAVSGELWRADIVPAGDVEVRPHIAGAVGRSSHGT
jgi:hypothetical protein